MPPTSGATRVPTWIWIITAFYLVSAAWAFLSLALLLVRINGGATRPNATQPSFVASLGFVDLLGNVLIAGVNAPDVIHLID